MSKYKMRVLENRRHEASIDDYFEDAAWIWKRDIDERSVFDLWLHVIDHCTRLVEAVRKERPKEVIDDLADTVMWFFSFLAQLRNSPSKIDEPFFVEKPPSILIWNKYPNRCPACLDFEFTELLDKTEELDPETALIKSEEKIEDWIDNTTDIASEPVPCLCLSRISFAEERHQRFKMITPMLDDHDLRLRYAQTA